jgi:hypothetical protein
MAKRICLMSVVVGGMLLGTGAMAAPTEWTDWVAATVGTPGSAMGTITLPGPSTIEVSYSGQVTFAQTSGGTDYWVPSAPYTSSVVGNPPTGSDIIALTGGTELTNTITFSQPVTDPVMAIVSLGQAGITVRYDFDTPFEILSQGRGFWGDGPLVREPGNVLAGTEGHGVIQFPGAVTSVSWTVMGSEFWHGFTVGCPREQPGPNVIPAPGAILLAALGTILVGYLRRRQSL